MKRSIYTGLHYTMVPLVLGRLKWLARKNRGYGENISQRFGHSSPRDDAPVWIHAVSVGETIAAEPLIRSIQAAHPDWPILITNTTPTGAEQTERLFGDSVSRQYAPYDLPDVIERFTTRVRPRILIVMETELWPNWVAALSKSQIPIMIANARLSEKSAAGYARLGSMMEEMMSSLTLVAAQYQADAKRFCELGVPKDAVKVLGNIKADIQVTSADENIAAEARSRLEIERSPVLIAASTHPGEDEIILDAFQTVRKAFPEALLYLVPRHPERAKDIQNLVADSGLDFKLRSKPGDRVKSSDAVVICDQMGELRGLFGVADLVLMGGTLVDHGGHNPLEPAAWGKPVIAGPSQRNFDSLFSEMKSKGALVRVNAEASDIAAKLIELWEDEPLRKQIGQAALKYLETQRGAAARLLEAVESLLSN